MTHDVIDELPINFRREIAKLGGEGILTNHDIMSLRRAQRRVFLLMADGEFHSATDIRLFAGRDGKPASEGLRRMRELRELPGVIIIRKRLGKTRDFHYKLAIDTGSPHQMELAL